VKQLTPDGQVVIKTQPVFRQYQHRDRFPLHSYNGAGWQVGYTGTGLYITYFTASLIDTIPYCYPIDLPGGYDQVEAIAQELISFVVPGWPAGAPGEAWNYWVKQRVTGKYNLAQWDLYLLSH
jgi:hypothetical protein